MIKFMQFTRYPNNERVVVNVFHIVFINPNIPTGSVLVLGSGENDYIVVTESIDEIAARSEWRQ